MTVPDQEHLTYSENHQIQLQVPEHNFNSNFLQNLSSQGVNCFTLNLLGSLFIHKFSEEGFFFQFLNYWGFLTFYVEY